MSQIVTDENGVRHSFPDEATPEMIAQALGASAPAASPSLWGSINQRVNEVGTGVVKGVADVLGLPGDIRQNDPNSLFMLGSLAPFLLPALVAGPTGEEIRDSAFDMVPASAPRWAQLPEAVPEDATGRYLQEAGRGAGSMLAFPGPTGPMMRAGALGGVGGEGAVDLSGTRGTGAEIWARLVGNILGAGGGAALEGAVRPTNPSILADATQGVKPSQFREAQALMDEARHMGAPLTGAEALSHVAGGNQYLGAMQRVAEQSRGGGAALAPFMAERTAGTGDAARRVIGGIGSRSSAPEGVAQALSGAADQAVIRQRMEVSAATKPFYEAARMAPADAKDIVVLMQKIDAEIAAVGPTSNAGRQLMAYRQRIAPDGVPVENIGALDQIYKETRDAVNALPTDPNAMQAAVRGVLGPINKDLGNTLSRMNDDLAYGRALHSIMTSEKVDPLTKGIIGRLTGAESFEKIEGVLAPMNPKDITPAALSRAVEVIQREQPEIVGQFIQRYLDATFSETTRKTIGGARQFGGPAFAARIGGNADQRKNLQAIVEALPGGQTTWTGFRRFLDILEAQGKRLPANSATEFNKQLSQDLATGTVKFTVKPLGALQEAYERWRYGANTSELARILTDPKSVDLIKKLAFEKPSTARAAAIAAAIVTGSTTLRPASR